MTGPLDVAVVIPAYNRARELDATLSSVLDQTCMPAEVLVIDDGSTDDTVAVARAWIGRLPLQVITQPNAGPAAARQTGIEAATTTYVALLDADDVWLSNHLELTAAARRDPSDLVSSNGLQWDAATGALGKHWTDQFPIPAPAQQRLKILRVNFVFIGAVFERESALAVGGFRNGFTAAEDWDLWIRLIRSGSEVIGVDEPTVHYRINPEGLTAGDDVYEVYARVVEMALTESVRGDERAAATRSLRWYTARHHLARSFAAARRAEIRVSRAEARSALGPDIRLSAEALAVLLAPRSATRLLDRVRQR